MTVTEILAKTDIPLRKIMTRVSPKQSVFFYSYVRKIFLKLLAGESIPEKRIMHDDLKRTFWGIDFSAPLFNAAGMFKAGDGYQTVARQGAGAFLTGTTTHGGRKGNFKNNILHPFISLPRTGIALNWMGLPNPGHSLVANKLSQYDKILGCPIGASIASDPLANEMDAIGGLIAGLQQYEKAGVDFIEINESCPNVPSHSNTDHGTLDKGLINRLESISRSYLSKRNRNLPVIVKLSVDTSESNIPDIIDLLLDLGYDGINLGNTSTKYDTIKSNVNYHEQKLFDHFTHTFGGGVSGSALKGMSLSLCKVATDHLKTKQTKQEFHIIRTGGIESSEDIEQTQKIGVSLSQWFTGYFDSFIHHGHDLYKVIFKTY
jgi:dihydroorotate dehydrogenase